MKTLLITGCTDPLLWYSHKVGSEVPFLGEDMDYYWSKEDYGYRNIVFKKDAIVKEQNDNCKGA